MIELRLGTALFAGIADWADLTSTDKSGSGGRQWPLGAEHLAELGLEVGSEFSGEEEIVE